MEIVNKYTFPKTGRQVSLTWEDIYKFFGKKRFSSRVSNAEIEPLFSVMLMDG